MKTSLVIPVYNEEKYIDKCLGSVVLQSVLPDEVVICDNNSTDNTVSIIKKYQTKLPAIKIVYETEKGIIPAMETAWRNANGEIILRIDADSTLPLNWVKNIVAHFEKDPKLAACGGVFYDNDGDVFTKTMMHMVHLLVPLYHRYKGYKILLGPNFAVRRDVLEKINGFYREFDEVDDQLISHKLAIRGYYYDIFDDCYNFHSSRRWVGKPFEVVRSAFSLFNPRFYKMR